MIWITSTRLQRFLWEMIGWRNWVQKLLDKQKVPNQPNQPNQTQIQFTEQGRLVETEQTSCSIGQEIDTRFSLDCKNTNLFVERSEKTKTQPKTQMQIEIERGDPLWTSISGCLDCHIQLWNKPKIHRKTTLTDKIFNPIYNKIMPTTHSVKSPRRWFRTWAM